MEEFYGPMVMTVILLVFWVLRVRLRVRPLADREDFDEARQFVTFSTHRFTTDAALVTLSFIVAFWWGSLLLAD